MVYNNISFQIIIFIDWLSLIILLHFINTSSLASLLISSFDINYYYLIIVNLTLNVCMRWEIVACSVTVTCEQTNRCNSNLDQNNVWERGTQRHPGTWTWNVNDQRKQTWWVTNEDVNEQEKSAQNRTERKRSNKRNGNVNKSNQQQQNHQQQNNDNNNTQ